MLEEKKANLMELSDLRTPWCIHVAATLRIADHIAAGNEHINDLAEKARCDPAALHNVLGHLVSKGVFLEPEPGRFELNDSARDLLDPSMHLTLDLEGIGGRLAHAWSTLLKYVRTGNPAYEDIFGLPFWDDLKAHPQIAEEFDALIGPLGHGTPNPEFEINGGWGKIKKVVDVGGGTGGFLAELLRIHPEIQGILVDQPETVARSVEVIRSAGVTERITTIGQSFFNPLPKDADLYLLRGVLNDWPDIEATAILRRCAEAARPTGRVVILKGVIPDDAPRVLEIEMVLVGGKKRTISEVREIAFKAGLQVLTAEQQANGYFVVECSPI